MSRLLKADWERALKQSTTVYVGNLSFYTREEQIYEVFSKVGFIDRVIMGLDKLKKTPCGFCFVEYYTRKEAERCVKYINSTVLDERMIRVDHDWGFQEGRQWGRGSNGGQVRDVYRQDYDPQRGGYGSKAMEELSSPTSDQGDGKRRRFGGYNEPRSAPQAQRNQEEENPRFKRGRRDSDDEEDR